MALLGVEKAKLKTSVMSKRLLSGGIYTLQMSSRRRTWKIFFYNAADTKQAFVKELEETAFMWNGELPPPTEHTRVAIRREDLSDRLFAPFERLADLDDVLADVITRQRSSFGAVDLKACPANDEEDDMDVPPDPDEPVSKEDEADATARFAPSDSWRRPSDYVAHMVQRFEDEWTNPRSGRRSRDL